MTRKDYELIAKIIREIPWLTHNERAKLATDFGKGLVGTNKYFDYVRFVNACIRE